MIAAARNGAAAAPLSGAAPGRRAAPSAAHPQSPQIAALRRMHAAAAQPAKDQAQDQQELQETRFV